MTLARVESVLLEIDGPQIIVLRDVLGMTLLGLATVREAARDQYLCVPVSSRRLAQFRHGEIDLRTMFTGAEVPELLQTFTTNEVLPDAEIELTHLERIPDAWLPGEGFLLTEFVSPVERDDRSIVDRAAERNRAVVFLTLNPPEARESAKIDANRLSEALALFQKTARHALTRAINPLTGRRNVLANEENYAFEVFGFAPGSFEVHMQAKALGDLWGQAPLTLALQKMDELASVVDNTQYALEVALENRGHFVGAFQSLLGFIASNKTPLQYSWTDPSEPHVRRCTISPAAAQLLYEVLSSRRELGEETKEFVGVFRKVDVNVGTWSLRTADGTEYRGTIAPDTEVSLSGLVVDTVSYRVRCRDVLTETVGTGRQASRLEILNYERHVLAL